jgi:hypothetical protein
MEVKLEVLNGPLAHEVYRIDEQHSFTFGRAPECTITVADDKTLAPFHFQIKVEPPLVWLVDCGSPFGVEVKHFLMGWLTVGGTIKQVSGIDSIYHYSELLRDRDYIRVSEHKFLLTIDMPRVCIECGVELTLPQKAISKFVGDICYCPICSMPDPDMKDPEGLEELESYIESIGPYFSYGDRARLFDFLNGHRARAIWLRGIFNNKDYIHIPPDYRKIHLELKALFSSYFPI